MHSQILTLHRFHELNETESNVKEHCKSVLLLGFALRKSCSKLLYSNWSWKEVIWRLFCLIQRQPCSCHMIATVVKHILQSCKQIREAHGGNDPYMHNVNKKMSRVKSVIQYHILKEEWPGQQFVLWIAARKWNEIEFVFNHDVLFH